MTSKYSEIIGQKFDKLHVVGILKPTSSKDRYRAECVCECGNTSTPPVRYLLRINPIRSCGCERNHGLSGHPLYYTWQHMRFRCDNPNDANFNNYGARGIKVCDEWNESFRSFYNWAKDRWRRGLELDRQNNDLGYSPDNCRFVTRTQNVNNRRNTRCATYKGEKRLLLELCDEHSMSVSTVSHRIRSGWSIESALLMPSTPRSERRKINKENKK